MRNEGSAAIGVAGENQSAKSNGLTALSDYGFRHRAAIDHAIEASLPAMASGSRNAFNEAVHRAIFPGGKRIRPLLTL